MYQKDTVLIGPDSSLLNAGIEQDTSAVVNGTTLRVGLHLKCCTGAAVPLQRFSEHTTTLTGILLSA